MDSELHQAVIMAVDGFCAEGTVRGRLSDEEIERLAKELDLDLSSYEAWLVLERMTLW